MRDAVCDCFSSLLRSMELSNKMMKAAVRDVTNRGQSGALSNADMYKVSYTLLSPVES